MADNTQQRLNVASQTVQAVTQIVNQLYRLQQLNDQRRKFTSPWIDQDFAKGSLQQLDAAMIGTFYDFCLPTLIEAFEDQAHGERNQQIMLQMREG